MVVLVGDEGRENEDDVIFAAEDVTPTAINFMARFCRGLICLTLTPKRCDELQLPPMVRRNGTKHGTAFTVSIEAATGIDTESLRPTVHTLFALPSRPIRRAASLSAFRYVFPLRAASGGVLMRAGHTEAGCDLALLAGKQPAAVICEVMKGVALTGAVARDPGTQTDQRHALHARAQSRQVDPMRR